MRASNLLFVISVFFFFNISAQSTIELSKDVSFYSSYPDINIDKTADTITYLQDGSVINYKNYRINNDVPFLNQTFVRRNDNAEVTVYSIEGNAKDENWLADPTKDTDTLFVVLDTIYGWGLFQSVYIDREINYSGVAAAIWINDTLGYISNLEHSTINIAAILMIGLDINIVFRDNFVHAKQDTVFLSASEAIHQIYYEPVDENGTYFGNLSGEYNPKFSLVFDLDNGGVFYTGQSGWGGAEYHISDYHGAIEMYFGASLYDWDSGSSNYLIEFPEQDSITQDITFSNDPDNLANAVLNYTYHDKRDYNKIGFAHFTKCITFTGNYGTMGMILSQEKDPDPYWEGILYMDMQETDKFGYCLQHYMKYVENGNSYHYIASPYYDKYNDSIAGFWGFTPNEDVHYMNNYDTLFFGKGAAYFWSVWSNFSERISCNSDNMGIWGNYFTPFANTNTYVIKDANGNTIMEGAGLEIFVDGLEPEAYTVELTNSFCPFNGYTGSSSLLASFDKSQMDPNPPPVSQIQLLNADNTIKYHFEVGEEILLKFSASDFIGYETGHIGIGFQPVVDSLTGVSIKLHNEAGWSEVYCQKIYNDSIIGTQYKAVLTDFLISDSAMYDLKISVEDYSGNSSVYSFNPAFIY